MQLVAGQHLDQLFDLIGNGAGELGFVTNMGKDRPTATLHQHVSGDRTVDAARERDHHIAAAADRQATRAEIFIGKEGRLFAG